MREQHHLHPSRYQYLGFPPVWFNTIVISASDLGRGLRLNVMVKIEVGIGGLMLDPPVKEYTE